MYNPFTDYINQIQNNQIVTNQPNKSIDQIFLLEILTTTAPILSRPSLAPLNDADT